MRTITNLFTINGCFGMSQIRYAVNMATDRCAPAARHLLAWHAAHLATATRALQKAPARRGYRRGPLGQYLETVLVRTATLLAARATVVRAIGKLTC